eukprot:scaffold216_cov340-Prasinococcus_capsulatus_cf.AAC.10
MGRQSVKCAETLRNMGAVHFEQQRYAEAAALFEEALQIYDACVGPGSIGRAKTWNCLLSARRLAMVPGAGQRDAQRRGGEEGEQ